MIKRDHGIAALQILLDRGIVHYCYVELAIIVAVEQSDTTSRHGVENVAAVGTGVRNRREAGFGGDVCEMAGEFGRRSR